MQSFDIDNYRLFVKNNIKHLYYKKSSLTEEQIIDYCSQFCLSVKEFFPDKNQSTTSEKLRKAFGNFLDNKPNAVAINNYLLFEYGYLYCNTCNTILDKESFYKSQNTWTTYKHYCIACQKLLRDNQHSRAYIANNRDKYSAYLAKYRAKKLCATPKWLTNTQLLQIQQFYTKAKDSGLEVDHIVPLQGENVCGLHVPWNLQLLSRSENASKSNKVL